MDEQEYLNLFKKSTENNFDNLNEVSKNEKWENLNKPSNKNDMTLLRETPDLSQFDNFQIEQRINGVPQQQNNHPYHSNPRRNRGGGLNGLDQFMDDDNLNEVVRQPVAAPTVQQVLAPPAVDNIKDVEVVSIEMFENMNSNALLTLANGKLSQIDASKVTGGGETTVRFLNS